MPDIIDLNSLFTELPVSCAFCRQSEAMGLMRLQDALVLSPVELVNLSGFTYQWLAELSVFLEKQGLLYLLQTTPGKSYG